jgi:hypothetical protein
MSQNCIKLGILATEVDSQNSPTVVRQRLPMTSLWTGITLLARSGRSGRSGGYHQSSSHCCGALLFEELRLIHGPYSHK